MKYVCCCSVLALLLALVSGYADDKDPAKKPDGDKKPDAKQKDDKKPEEKKDEKKPPKKEEEKDAKEKLIPGGVVRAKLAHVEAAQRTLTVDIPKFIPYITRYGIRYSTINQQERLLATDDLKVRMLRPPVDFDLKGRPRKYTSKELKELRGPDSKLPGYTAEFDSLKTGQVVDLYLGKKKTAAKSGSRDRQREKEPEEKPEVTMIVIVAEPIK